MKKLILLLLVLWLPPAVGAQNRAIVFRNVTVIDMTGEKPKSNMTVLVSGNRIAKIDKNAKAPENAEIIDARGKFLIPGLWDMHVHTLFEGRTEMFFPMFIANGVTGVRDLGSPLPLEQANRIRREIEEGKTIGPRLGALTGRILDGAGTPLLIADAVRTPEDGRRLVRTLKQQGADFIKVYDLLARDAFLAIVDEARREKISLAGHIPFSVSAAEVSDLGQRTIEHNTDIFISASRNEAELRSELRGAADPALSNQTRNRAEISAIDSYDGRKAAGLFARFVRNGTFVCPTNTARNAATFSDPAEIESDRRLKYLPFSVRANWANIFKSRITPIGTLEQRRRRFQKHLELTGAMRRAGVLLLAGTDTGYANVGTFAGFTLHDELALLVRGGLTPFQALETATVNPARFLGLGKSLGTIEKGKLADLVLLDADPLADIKNTTKIAAVVADGRYFSKAELDKMLARVEALAER